MPAWRFDQVANLRITLAPWRARKSEMRLAAPPVGECHGATDGNGRGSVFADAPRRIPARGLVDRQGRKEEEKPASESHPARRPGPRLCAQGAARPGASPPARQPG